MNLRQPFGVYAGTREQWLNEVANILTPILNEARQAIIDRNPIAEPKNPHKVRPKVHNIHRSTEFKPHLVSYSCSLVGGGMKKTSTLAHAHTIDAGMPTQRHEIRMGVTLGSESQLDSCKVADVLLHEMIHTMAVGHGHRGAFPHIAKEVGLTGRMTATVANEELTFWLLENVVQVLGQYPHQAVELIPRGRRGIGSRSIKVLCDDADCGCTFRLTQKWIDLCPLASPYCPVCGGTTTIMR
jgi:hypothetical protein